LINLKPGKETHSFVGFYFALKNLVLWPRILNYDYGCKRLL